VFPHKLCDRICLLLLEGYYATSATWRQPLKSTIQNIVKLSHFLIQEDPDCLERQLCWMHTTIIDISFGLPDNVG
jgi:hypothetical protein